jgi:hypothetical protein
MTQSLYRKTKQKTCTNQNKTMLRQMSPLEKKLSTGMPKGFCQHVASMQHKLNLADRSEGSDGKSRLVITSHSKNKKIKAFVTWQGSWLKLLPSKLENMSLH